MSSAPKKRSAEAFSAFVAQDSVTGSGGASRAFRKRSVCLTTARARAVLGPTSKPCAASGSVTTRTSAWSSVAAAWKRSIDSLIPAFASRPAFTTSIGGIEAGDRRR